MAKHASKHARFLLEAEAGITRQRRAVFGLASERVPVHRILPRSQVTGFEQAGLCAMMSRVVRRRVLFDDTFSFLGRARS